MSPELHVPHLLYLVWGYPPCRGSGVHRALATANSFARAGWRVTVITAERETFERFTGADPSLEARIDPGVTVERIPFSWPAQETDIRRYGRLRITAPAAWLRLRRMRDLLAFPEVGYGPWRRPLTKAALAVHKREPVDLVVATANPHVTFAAAAALWRRHRVPYVMDYRDAWTLDVFSGERLHGPRSRAARLEGRYLSHSLETWFVNEPIRQWHVAQYPRLADRMHVVANGWDPEVIAPIPVDDEGAPDEPLTFGYLGTLSRNVPVGVLLEGWRAAVDAGTVPHGSRLVLAGYLGFYASPRSDIAKAIETAGDSVAYLGPVPKAEVGDFYRTVDVNVLALGTGKYVTSGKVYEYLATGKPIVSVHDPHNAASSVLDGYPLWAPVEELSASAVAEAFARASALAGSATTESRRAAVTFAQRYRRDLQFAPRLEALSAVVNA